MNVKKIYLDMDGVLADFDRGVIELLGRVPLKQGISTREEDDELYEAMRQIDHFYGRLEPMEGAKKLFNTISNKYGDKCEILTGVPNPRRGIEQASSDKIEWVKRYLSDSVVCNTVRRVEKIQFCTGKDCILIDDFDWNINDWENAGGTGILYTDCESTLNKLKEFGIL